MGKSSDEGHFRLVTSLCSLSEVIGIPGYPGTARDDPKLQAGEPEGALVAIQSVLHDSDSLLQSVCSKGRMVHLVGEQASHHWPDCDWDASD